MKRWRWGDEEKIIYVGRQFAIAPPWIEVKNRIRISLTYGTSFGTGVHETTVSCIEEMEKIDMRNKKVLDIGTGSGILSIAASKLGASEIQAFDVDPTCVSECSENLKLNSINNVKCFLGDDPGAVSGTFDIIMANIFDYIILKMSRNIRKASHSNTHLILSGISHEETYRTKTRFKELGFSYLKTTMLEEYTTMVFKLKGGDK